MAVAKKTPIPSASSQGGFPGVSKVTCTAPRGPNPVPIGDTGGAKRPMPTAVQKGKGAFEAPTGKEVPRIPGETESAPVSTIGSENQSILGQAGSYVGQIMAGRPGMQARPDVGDNWNVSSNPGGKTGGFPDASGGDGSGRKPQSIVGSNVAAPRTPFDADQMGEGPKPRGSF